MSCSLLASVARGQETLTTTAVLPPPATKLESVETNVGTVLIKGASEIGSVSANTGVVSVKCRVITDTTTGREERGLAIDIGEKGLKDRMLMDYDEIAPLLKALDYLNKVDASATPLNAFDAVYTTKGGFRIAAMGARRTGSIQFSLRDARVSMAPVQFSRDEMNRFWTLVEQAKKQLDTLGKKQ